MSAWRSKREPLPSKLEQVGHIIDNPLLYAQVAAIPEKETGRPRHYPVYAWLLYEAAVSIYKSARAVEAEFGNPRQWSYIKHKVKRHFPDEPAMWLPDEPMRRCHYAHARRYLADEEILEDRRDIVMKITIEQAKKQGLLMELGPTSWTHPELVRMMFGDSKVIESLYKAKPGTTRVKKSTGEIVPVRCDSDASIQREGGGDEVYGTRHNLVHCAGPGGALIIGVDHVPHSKGSGGEPAMALRRCEKIAALAPDVQGLIWDGALRGVHINHLMTRLGWLAITPVAAKRRHRRKGQKGGHRVPKDVLIEQLDLHLEDGMPRKVGIHAVDGAATIALVNDEGRPESSFLERIRTQRIYAPRKQRFRWNNQYRLPKGFLETEISLRLHGNEEDKKRRLNRAEVLRAIPFADPDYARLYHKRSHAESINRVLEDSLFIKKAHSVGRHRQQADLLGFALWQNSLTLARARPRERIEAA